MKPSTARRTSSERALGGAVGRRLDVAPVRERRVDAAAEHREHALDVALQLALVLERVQVLPERERGRHVGGEGHVRALQLERLAGPGRRVEPAAQPLGRDADDVEVAVQMVRVERHHGEPPLRAPLAALGREHAVDAHLAEHVLDLAPAPVAVRPLAQDRVDRVRLGERDHRHRADREAEHRPVPARPVLEREVQPRVAQLQRVPGSRHAARPRQLGDRRGWWGAAARPSRPHNVPRHPAPVNH